VVLKKVKDLYYIS